MGELPAQQPGHYETADAQQRQYRCGHLARLGDGGGREGQKRWAVQTRAGEVPEIAPGGGEFADCVAEEVRRIQVPRAVKGEPRGCAHSTVGKDGADAARCELADRIEAFV